MSSSRVEMEKFDGHGDYTLRKDKLLAHLDLLGLSKFLEETETTKKKEESAKIKAAGKAWYQTMLSDSDYTEFDNFTKWLGVNQ